MNKSYKAIISIDFGSSYSGYSVGFSEKVIEAKSELIQPTTIIIKKDNLKGYKYGNVAEKEMDQMEPNDKYIYFDRIKTLLDPELLVENKSKIYVRSTYPSYYKISLGILIKEYLRMMSDDALLYYNNKQDGKYNKEDIKWIITVPAIWNEYGKQYMRNYARKAGLNSIVIALEPEAASLTMFKNNNVEDHFKGQGKVFMLIDAGGYTLDITINEIIDEDKDLKQLSPPSGGAYGSMKINEHLIKIIEETFTKEKIKELKEKKFYMWHRILHDIEETKKSITFFGIDSEYFKFTMPFGTMNWKDKLKYYIFRIKKFTKPTSYGDITYDYENTLYIPKEIFKKIILEVVTEIIEHITMLIKEFPNIDLIVLVGGFSNNIILKEEIKKNFNITFRQLTRPELTIMEGAVKYGFKPNQIVSRKSPYTVGIETCKDDNNDTCIDFDIFIIKGYDIKNNQEVTKKYIPHKEEQNKVLFPLYFSTKENPKFTNEEGVFKMSEFSMIINEAEKKLPKEERLFEIQMKFGSCISVRGKNLNSNESKVIFSNYYNRKN